MSDIIYEVKYQPRLPGAYYGATLLYPCEYLGKSKEEIFHAGRLHMSYHLRKGMEWMKEHLVYERLVIPLDRFDPQYHCCFDTKVET